MTYGNQFRSAMILFFIYVSTKTWCSHPGSMSPPKFSFFLKAAKLPQLPIFRDRHRPIVNVGIAVLIKKH